MSDLKTNYSFSNNSENNYEEKYKKLELNELHEIGYSNTLTIIKDGVQSNRIF